MDSFIVQCVKYYCEYFSGSMEGGTSSWRLWAFCQSEGVVVAFVGGTAYSRNMENI